MEKLGFFMLGISGLIFAVSHSYVTITYMIIDKTQYERMSQLEQVSN
jgi:hypothetical protein